MPRRSKWMVAALVALLPVALAACGSSASSAEEKAARALKACRAQWREVGQIVDGMDQDNNPSALSERWTSVIATVEYYKTTGSAKNCQANVESQLKAVTSLRQFSEKLRPYDMTYQLSQARAAIELYLADPLPEPVREDGTRVRPPTKAAVTEALHTLEDNAAEANAELAPGWGQTSSVDLTDVDSLTTTMHDLDFLAQSSPHWRQCEEALQVLVAAIRFQDGLAGTASSGPSDATTPAG